LARDVGGKLGLDDGMAALGVVEMVDENMANAALVHAVESGSGYDGRAMIAFGGGGPVHGGRVAEKIGIDRVFVPVGAGVGSAIGFLRAPVAYDVVRSLYQRLSRFDVAAVNALLDSMRDEASAVVSAGSFGAAVTERRIAFMRYVGQGHEIAVPLPARTLTEADVALIRAAYDTEYARVYDRPVPNSDIEVLSYAVVVATETPAEPDVPASPAAASPATPTGFRDVRDTATGEVGSWALHERAALAPGATLRGPAIIGEAETSTLVGPGWSARVAGDLTLVLERG
jgi:N-methylhydantoinase A